MDVWPEFFLEIPYDETTFDEVMANVAEEFPASWRAYHRVDTRESLSIDEDGAIDARELMITAGRLARAAEELSTRKLPARERAVPSRLEFKAREERQARESFIASLESLLEDGVDADAEQGISTLLNQLRRLTSAEDVFRVFRCFIEIEAFERYGKTPGQLADRLLRLLNYLTATHSLGTRQYLTRVARCYVLELRPELAVMARAVMESALKSLELEAVVLRARSVRGAASENLVDWVEAATKAGLLDEEARLAADFVRHAGNDAVHTVAGLEPNEDQIMENLLRVLDALNHGGSAS